MSDHEHAPDEASADQTPADQAPSTPSAASSLTPVAQALSPAGWTQLAAGPVAFLASLMPFYTVSVSMIGLSSSGSVSAWHGFFGWAAAVLALAGSAALAVELFAPQVKLPLPAVLASVGGFGLGLLFTLIAWFVTPGADSSVVLPGEVENMIDFGRGFGFYLLLVAVAAGLATAVFRLRSQPE